MLSKMIADILNGDDPWRYATFEGAVQLQLKIDARTSLAEKLEWLEQAGRLARQLGRQANVSASDGERAVLHRHRSELLARRQPQSNHATPAPSDQESDRNLR